MEKIHDKYKVLLVEDDLNLGQILQEYLQVKGYDTFLCKDGKKVLDLCREKRKDFDICILDIMLPKMDGFSLAKEIIKNNENMPIIFLTAKSLKEDTLQGFKIGADDYITKPFVMKELLARIKAVIKRTNKYARMRSSTKRIFKIGNFTFNSNIQKLSHPSTPPRKLTSKENALLRLLCVHKNNKLFRSYALREIWSKDDYFNSRSMDVYITRLRKYLKVDEQVKIINIHGQGFRLVEIN